MSVQYLYIAFHSSVEMYRSFSICSFISSWKYLFSPLWLHEGSLVVLKVNRFL